MEIKGLKKNKGVETMKVGEFLRVKVDPESSSEDILWQGKKLILKIKEKAEMGKANKRVLNILSFIFPKKSIELVKGHKSKNKIFKIYDKKH